MLPPNRADSTLDRMRRARAETIAYHHRAVARVLGMMRQHFNEDLSLGDMADIALISPYHFNRVFRRMAGIPPRRFLSALRLETAKQLLVNTSLSVTDICYEVGYNSLGSFMRRFKETVGLPPRIFRTQSRSLLSQGLAGLREAARVSLPAPPNGGEPAGVGGVVSGPPGFAGLIFVGLFADAIPQSLPAACAILLQPGPFRIDGVPDGRYFALAGGLPAVAGERAMLLNEGLLRGAFRTRVAVRGGRAAAPIHLALQTAGALDPPILLAFPMLLQERLQQGGRGLKAIRG